jgi:hypothetical protein
VAQIARVSTRTVRKWEHGQACPTEDHWQALGKILRLDHSFPQTPIQRQSSPLVFTQLSRHSDRNKSRARDCFFVSWLATIKIFRSNESDPRCHLPPPRTSIQTPVQKRSRPRRRRRG